MRKHMQTQDSNARFVKDKQVLRIVRMRSQVTPALKNFSIGGIAIHLNNQNLRRKLSLVGGKIFV